MKLAFEPPPGFSINQLALYQVECEERSCQSVESFVRQLLLKIKMVMSTIELPFIHLQ